MTRLQLIHVTIRRIHRLGACPVLEVTVTYPAWIADRGFFDFHALEEPLTKNAFSLSLPVDLCEIEFIPLMSPRLNQRVL